MKLSEKEFLLLGMIAPTAGVSGTSLKEFIIQRNVKAWTNIGFSSIYYILDQLEHKGLVQTSDVRMEESRDIKEGAPQKIYTMTDLGKTSLKQTIRDYFQTDYITPKDINLALAASYVMTKEELLEELHLCKKKMEKRLNDILTRANDEEITHATQNNIYPFRIWALFRHPQYFVKAEIEFMTELINKLQNEPNYDLN